ncbi:hypothetical protein BLM37_02090 [Candidatus Gracilibacteria bacterium GN02-873]|nr:hypothetical protein BLM37_02090 [Candidatus Gracilibacteria bacterium GN02-873]
MTNPSPFDEFFKNISSSPEFRALTGEKTTNSADFSFENLEKNLREIEASTAKANDLMRQFDTNFATEDAKKIGNSVQNGNDKTPPKTGKPTDDELKITIEVRRPEKKNPETWGFNGVAGMTDLKRELNESFIKPLKFKFLIEKLRQNSEKNANEKSEKNTELLEKLYSEYEKFKISIPTGMLLYGPPGTGKTFITKKLAEEIECGFVSKNMGEFGSSYLHQTTKNIKDFFDGVKKIAENEPIILFLDEIDSLLSARTNNVDSNKAEEVSQFLQEFNALEEAKNLIVIAATNRPDHLDSAILRSGRLDKKIYIGPPDETAREELFRMYIEKMGRPHEKLDYHELAILTTNYVSADIEAICDEVARDASRNLLDLIDEAESGALTEKHLENHKITMEMLRETILEMPSSLKMVDMSIYENWLAKIS